MEQLTHLIDAVRGNPLLGVGILIGVLAAAILLLRKPRIQREADARLSALRRDKADQYGKLRPPR